VQGPRGEVRALGTEGLRACPDWRATGLPREVLVVTPAVWRGNLLVAAPLAGLSGGWRAETVRPFHLFGLSH
jgi:tRNA(Ile)-lysidine synthase